MARLPRPVTTMISASPEATASSTTYWMVGLSTSGNISLGWALVAGKNRVPRPAAGNTPFRTVIDLLLVVKTGGAPPGPFGCHPSYVAHAHRRPATRTVAGPDAARSIRRPPGTSRRRR